MGILERKEREKEARRGAILDAAETIFTTKGFLTATMDDIAREAELAKGTVYLYYKSKDELLLGLVMRGLDFLLQSFHDEAEAIPTAFGKLLSMGDAYWNFANGYPFYFVTMNMMEMPERASSEQIDSQLLMNLHERSNAIWREMIGYVDQAKLEGMVRPEVDSFTFSILLWMNTTSTLRFEAKIKRTPNDMWKQSEGYNPCDMDFRAMYKLNALLLFHQIVTDLGRTQLAHVTWPTLDPRVGQPAPEIAQSISNPDEGIPYEFLQSTSL